MNGGAKSVLDGAEILKLDPNTIDIDLSGRIGFFFPDKAAAFGRIMRKDGQQDLVKVSRAPEGSEFAWRLHVGLHRTVGARDEGLPIYAIEVSGTPEELAVLEEQENLIRRVMEPLEKAKFIGAFSDAVQARFAREHGNLTRHQRAAKARWAKARNDKSATESALQQEVNDACATMARAYEWQESAQDAFGFSKRTVQRSIKIYRQIIVPFDRDLVRQLADHAAGKEQNSLLDIATIQVEDHRKAVIEALVADPELGVDDAQVRVGIARAAGPAPLPYQKHFDAIKGGWGRLGRGERERFVRDGELIKLLTPGLMRELRDQIDKELGDD